MTLADFAQLSFQDNLTNSANLTSSGADFQFATTTVFQAATDAAQACVGTCTAPENSFTPSPVPPVATFARSDSLLEGVPIAGTGFNVGVHAGTIGETSLDGVDGLGRFEVRHPAHHEFTFVLEHAIGDANIEFDATTFLRAWTAAEASPARRPAPGSGGRSCSTMELEARRCSNGFPMATSRPERKRA